jgi:DNA invertase Pin-like site-specific DNA recombinase
MRRRAVNPQGHFKVASSHLKRKAYLYVRQSSLRQVVENTESTKRQYALRGRAVALGWPSERVIVIDDDLGQSGASTTDRQGFKRLVSEVGLGRAGIVLGLEVSRLARNSVDWHRLLEICALTGTLILDEDGLYDPCCFNDRLLLGLKGTMSEAELHLIRARLQGGIRNKALRGELKSPLPTGLVYDEKDRVVLDPDRQVRQTLATFFETYDRAGSALAVVQFFSQQKIRFPSRLRRGIRKGELVWVVLSHNRALQVLHNPRYAGAFVYGRTKSCKSSQGRNSSQRLSQDQWQILLPNTHPGYITWEQYQRNQRRLRECAQARGLDRRKSPPRSGAALLSGLVLCGVCGRPMSVRYQTRKGRVYSSYHCQPRQGYEQIQQFCQQVPATGVDEQIGALLLEMVTPVTLEVALMVQEELQARLNEATRLRRQQVERARYETQMARHRYMQVDPLNRLVADALEADWNEKLRALGEAQEQYEAGCRADRVLLDEEKRKHILALATDFPRLWRDPRTPQRERKRMVRLLIEDVTLIRGDQITAHVRFKGGATRTLTLPRPRKSWENWKTGPEVLSQIDHLLDDCTDAEVAEKLNQQGLRSGKDQPFTRRLVARLRGYYQIPSRYDRLRKAGMLTQEEIAKQLDVCTATIQVWRKNGLLVAHRYNDNNEYLYEPPGDRRPVKSKGRKFSDPKRMLKVLSRKTKKVQNEA